MPNVNDKPCKDCEHYDPIIVGDGSKGKPARGWCAVKSVYPAQEPEGRTFPIGVKRVAHGTLAKPHIVIGRDVQGHCMQFKPKP